MGNYGLQHQLHHNVGIPPGDMLAPKRVSRLAVWLATVN